MMTRAVYGLVAVVIVLGAVAGWVYAYAEPTRATIATDLLEIGKEIEAAETEAAQYQGGAILAQIRLRQAILRNTEAMLDQKRRALLRLIALDFVIEGQRVPSLSEDQLAALEKEIGTAETELAKAKVEALTSGGLVGALAKVTVETSRATLAMLKMKYYTGKYGIPLMLFDFDKVAPTKTPAEAPGKAVKDEDALR